MIFNQKQRLIYAKNFFNSIKIPVIPPLLIDSKLVSDFKENANRFNEFFSRQCTPLNNGSECSSHPIFVTNKRHSSVVFDNEDIIKIIRALNINKSHGHDDISITMIKMYDSLLMKPLSIIFSNCVKTGTFPYIYGRNLMLYLFTKK